MHPDSKGSGSARAIVTGASFSGLLCAAELAGYFESVILIERDSLADLDAQFRAGTPQDRHPHMLLARGEQLLEQRFPGIGRELAAAGAEQLDWANDCLYVGSFGELPRYASTIRSHVCSRSLLLATLRRRVLSIPNIQLLAGCQVTGLIAGNHGEVRGVQLRDRVSAVCRSLDACLVVDAGGRHSQAPQWLQRLGCAQPSERVVDSRLGYASRWYEVPSGWSADWKVLQIVNDPPKNTRAGFLMGAEHGRWQVTVAGVNGDHPPTDVAGFSAFVDSLGSPRLQEAIAGARPLSRVYGFRDNRNRWRRFDELTRWPTGLVVVGDALCAVNPVFAQGMTLAILHAAALREALLKTKADTTRLWRAYQRVISPVLADAWRLVTSEDLRWPGTEGGTASRLDGLFNRYANFLFERLAGDAQAIRTFYGVLHMLKSPYALLSPKLAGKALTRSAPKAIGAGSPAARGRM